LYLGATIGFQRIKYSEESTFLESAEYELEGMQLSSYRFIKSENAVGDGINLKLGAIYRVNNIVRAGFAYHSPTFISMNSSTERRFSSDLADGQAFGENAPTQINEYNLSSPSKLIGSLAFIINKKGVLNVDYEFADYSNMKLRPSGLVSNDFSEDNQDIKTYFQSTNNVRVGGEVRLQPFSLRGGVAYYENPNTDGTSLYAADKLFYTAGVGYKRNDTYLDFAFRLKSTNEDKYLYSSEFSELTEQEYTGTSISATWGVRF
jgi:long-subunit fatty acid transport protein